MKNLIFILLFSVVMCVPGCTSITVTYDYDREFDFSTLYAYDWIFIPEWSGADELMAEQLKRAVDGELEMRGYALKPAYPDFLISVRARREKKTELYESGYVRDPYYSRGYPFGDPFDDGYYPYRRIETREYEVGVISIEFLDALKKKPIWRATATGIIDPDRRPGPEEQERVIEKLVAKILGKFPPL